MKDERFYYIPGCQVLHVPGIYFLACATRVHVVQYLYSVYNTTDYIQQKQWKVNFYNFFFPLFFTPTCLNVYCNVHYVPLPLKNSHEIHSALILLLGNHRWLR